MIGRDSHEDGNAYGVWPWIGGLLLAAGLIGMMFLLAKPIS